MAIRVNLDRVLLDRRMSLTELAKPALCALQHWMHSAGNWIASPPIFWFMNQMKTHSPKRLNSPRTRHNRP